MPRSHDGRHRGSRHVLLDVHLQRRVGGDRRIHVHGRAAFRQEVDRHLRIHAARIRDRHVRIEERAGRAFGERVAHLVHVHDLRHEGDAARPGRSQTYVEMVFVPCFTGTSA